MKKTKSSFTSRTPWRAKLEKLQEPKIVDTPRAMVARCGEGKMLVPTPLLVDSVVRKIPKGRLATVGMIRERLAREFNADTTCPLTTGIFLRITAEAAEEDRKLGRKSVAPYWRVVKDDGSLNPKFPGGVRNQAAHLKSEGFLVHSTKRGSAAVVEDFEKRFVIFI